MSGIGIRPRNDYVIVERIEEKVSSLIIVLDSAKEKSLRCRVLATGPGELQDDGRRKEPQVKTGDTVLIERWAGQEFKTPSGAKKFLVDRKESERLWVHEWEILAVLED